ncbi:MAG: VPS10 domain-containing protein [Thermoanaerobaculia bacterium]
MKILRSTALIVAALLVSLTLSAETRADAKSSDSSRMNAETFKGLELRGIGPGFMSGRIADIVIHPADRATWYVAVGSGGVWKTTNSGTTWAPIFDDQGSYSIGCITLDPQRPDTVWVGTGENVGGRHVGYGDGVYRSLDGGKSWTKMGLEKSEHIGTILVHPDDSNVVYVASQGPLWKAGGERGLFKTVDGGKSWQKILGGGDYTGVNEVRMDPRDPDVLYATTHHRFRNVAALINVGPESSIHKSTDGGKTWRKVTKGLPEENMGKIGLAISPQRPDVVYATIELAHHKGNFYRSEDGGESWEKRADYISGGTGPHYYQELFASPHQFDRIYQMDVFLHVSDDGGKTFREVGETYKHVDNHALAFVGSDPDYLLAGCDGGVYESFDLGATWKFASNLPVTQFYKVTVDYDTPFYNIYGGTQDNSTMGGPSRTTNQHGASNGDWFIALGADGHQPAADPTNPDIVYCEWQEGNLNRFDRKTGEVVYIQPQPGANEPSDRFNWDAPILISPHASERLYYASQRVWRSDDRGDSWRAISGDLTRGIDRLRQPTMGRVQSFDAGWDFYAMSMYGTITSLSESPLAAGVVYAGTDDGIIQVTEDGGATWRKIDKLPGVAPLFFVNDIKADLHDVNTVYVVVDHHKNGDFAPYVFRSADRGRTWTSITGDLPVRHVVWRIVQDHVKRELLFAGTEFGVFFTVDAGKRWIKLQGEVPNIPFRDLAIQKREDDLVGATFGRGFFVFDDYAVLRSVSEASLAKEVDFFPLRKASWYVQRSPLGDEGKGTQGDAFYTAPNPPFGAVFTYYLRDELRTKKKARTEAEKKLIEKGTDTPAPGWDAILAEEREEEPAILLTVLDSTGNVVRKLTGPVEAGFHRVAWDLRYASREPWTAEKTKQRWAQPFLAMAPPGKYTVRLAKRVDGVVTDLGLEQNFEVESIRRPALTGTSAADTSKFHLELAALQREIEGADSTIEETKTRLEAIRESLMNTEVRDTTLDDEVRRLETTIHGLDLRLSGSQKREFFGDPGPVSIKRRLNVAIGGNTNSLHGPTATHRMSANLATAGFVELKRELKQLVEVDLKALEAKIEAAGVPWTPGRIVGGR